MNEKELDIVIYAFIERDMCFDAYDTLSVGYDACMQATEELEGINTILTNDLQMSKVVSESLQAEKVLVEKQLKKEIRKKKFNAVLLWSVSGAGAALMVLYLLK